jgi:hypothetical protein
MINKNSKYYRDLNTNKVLEEFLDDYLYKPSTIRNISIDKQYKGIDTEFKTFKIDEKTNIDWKRNHPTEVLNTFLLELSITLTDDTEQYDGITNEGKKYRYNGYLGDTNENNSYLFVWVDRAYFLEDGSLRKEDIKEVEVALVEVDAIDKYLTKKGFSKSNLKKIVNHVYTIDSKPINKEGLKIWYNKKSKEQSITILLPREELLKIATKKTKIKR